MGRNHYEGTDARRRRQDRTKREAELYRAIRYLGQLLELLRPTTAYESALKLAARAAHDDAMSWYVED
jgi:hypothetical protein